MHILGISCFYHDAAACIIRDGALIAACQEERFSRVKHDWRFPEKSIRYCLREAGIGIERVDSVCFYEKPFLKLERALETFLAVAPRGFRAFLDTMPSWLNQKLRLRHIVGKTTGYPGKLLFAEHHAVHAASAYYASPFEESAILTVDGVGEWATASYGSAQGNTITLTHEMRFPHSLGLLYSAVTSYLGFAVNNDEYKVMGMAPYGTPGYLDVFLNRLMKVHPDGSLDLNMKHFSFQYGRQMVNIRKFRELFGIPPRPPDGEISEKHYDLAASLQKAAETVILAMAEHVHRKTGSRNLCLAGGVALNSVANGRLLREGPFDNIFVQPAAGDAGGAVGAAYVAYYQGAGKADRHALHLPYLGPSFSAAEIRSALTQAGVKYSELAEEELLRTTAALLSDGKVMGWFQGRMEFGPRALGNRSILADPRRPEMKDIINRKVKFRESFRPFAPVVIEEDASRYFQLDAPSPYMLFTVPVVSDEVPAVTHVDNSARVQTVSKSGNPLLHALLRTFEERTGIPVLLNTSLNIKGEPIALTPEDAIRCFQESALDGLVLGNCLTVRERA